MQTREFKEKLIKLLSPHMDEKQAAELGEQTEADLKKIVENSANIKLLSTIGDRMYDTFQQLQRRDMVTNISELNTTLLEFLNEYLKNPADSEKIATNLLNDLLKEIKSSKELYTIQYTFADNIYNVLRVIPDKKKLVELTIKYPAGDLFTNFEKKYKDKYKAVNNEIQKLLDPILESLFSGSNAEEFSHSLENQIEATDKIENEVEEFIKKELPPFKKILFQKITEARAQYLQMMPRNISRDAQMNFQAKMTQNLNSICEERLKSAMDLFIKEWCNGKPEAVVKAIDFEMIKTRLTFSATMELAQLTLPQDIANYKLSVEPAKLNDEERYQAQADLFDFLRKVKNNNLEILLAEKLVDMDVSDLRLKDAMEDFRYVMFSLPKEIQESFVKKTMPADFDLNLGAWKPNLKILSLLKHPHNIIIRAPQYAQQYEKHCLQLKVEEKQLAQERHNEQLLELNKIADKIDLPKVNSLVSAVKNLNQSMFDLFIAKCSLATLKEVIKQVTEPSFKTKDESQLSQYVAKLKTREKELQSFTLVVQPSFFKAVPESKGETTLVAVPDGVTKSLATNMDRH